MMSFSWPIVFRIIAAVIGGYVAAALASLALVPLFVFILNSQLSDAVYAATMWSYVVFFVVFIASFSVKKVQHVYWYLVSFYLLCLLIFSYSHSDILQLG